MPIAASVVRLGLQRDLEDPLADNTLACLQIRHDLFVPLT